MQTNQKKSCCTPQRQQSKSETRKRCKQESTSRSYHTYENMKYLSGGTFIMGADLNEGYSSDAEGPKRLVTVEPFYISPYTVTNEQFHTFVQKTGYITDAEKYGWSFVFHLLVSESTAKKVKEIVPQTPWWWVVEGASWQCPEGPDSTIDSRLDHPVVHISWNDAIAYCSWSNCRLPTETEWEYAARGGLQSARYPWGNELLPNGEHRCNIWQGTFPHENTNEDGYISTAPVHTFPPNGFGLYNMVGNVWEWCANSFYPHSQHEDYLNVKAMRGGSFLCHASYCNRYRNAARSSNTADSSASNIGFRCVMSKEKRMLS
ncbi:formylglycine-generating enzyme family protein [Alkalihalobacillus sp. LMS39]|uniref:formylglycine-generating enzyme family protein n=1 Tax=Alkalihalobacillus sp. LMS39 TaxID=2924032 RepID=UPI001FB37C67|nr:formylglycine-generating enzyme family protein [Alkalihalobacillus sp. LMS39]UOE94820.1 formylglycine-generating enzyme family protein [Alkalihalobacillus sp. LMS39]